MEKLILRCGRYVPPATGSAEERLRLLERYLARLTEELERLPAEWGAVAIEAAQIGTDAVVAGKEAAYE
jgi:hypothetical protein